MLDKLFSVVGFAAVVVMTIGFFALVEENADLRNQLEEPCNCTQVCEAMFEEMGC